MRTYGNDLEGRTIEVSLQDDLRKVPSTHRALVTPRVAEVFRDPHSYFADVARRTPIPAMRAWLEAMLEGVCTLRLNTTFEPAWNDASFHWTAQNLTGNSVIEIGETDPIGAEIVLPEESNLAGFRPAMQAYYSLVGEVRWCGIGNAGRLFKGTCHSAIFVGEIDEESRLHWESVQSRALNPRETFQFGSCDDGTPLTYTRDGKAGLWGFPARDKGFTQTMEDVVNWVYSELLAGRRPAGLD